jgi:hypothetical protein
MPEHLPAPPAHHQRRGFVDGDAGQVGMLGQDVEEAITKPGTASWPNLIAQRRLSELTQAELSSRRFVSLLTFPFHLDKPSHGSASACPPPEAARDLLDSKGQIW